MPPITPNTVPPYEERWNSKQLQECTELWNLSTKEQSQLIELKERIKDDMKDYWGNSPFELVRFVLEYTCHHNINTMERRVRHCVKWRQEHYVDTILEEYAPPIVCYRFPAAIMEHLDHDNDPIFIVRSGVGDPLDLLHRYGREELIQCIYWGVELAIRGPWQDDYIEQNHRKPKMCTAVVDLHGLNRRHYHPSLLLLTQHISHPLQMHYPHMVKKILIVNAPTIFRFVWTLFRPFIFPHLRSLIEVATEYETEELISQYMDVKALPKEMLPEKGQGTVARGYNPIWEGGPLPQPHNKEDTDWERIPIIYDTHSNSCSKEEEEEGEETRGRTGTMSSNQSYMSSGWLETNNSDKECEQIQVSTRSILKGTWDKDIAICTIR